MGTRGLTAAVIDGEFKIAQYGQWDHYPTGQGQTIVSFILNELDTENFKVALRECSWIDTERHKAMWVECGADPNSTFVSMDISNKFKEKYPHLSRDTGADILRLVQNEGARELQNSVDFAGDSLWCEYAYVVDMDNEVLEIYGGSGSAHPERFAFLEKTLEEFSPVKLLVAIPFAELEETSMNLLEQSMYEDEEI